MNAKRNLWGFCGLYAVALLFITGVAVWRMPFYKIIGTAFVILFLFDILIGWMYCRVRWKKGGTTNNIKAVLFLFLPLFCTLLFAVAICFQDMHLWPAFARTYFLGGIAVLFLLKFFFAALWFLFHKKAAWMPWGITLFLFFYLLYAMVISTFNLRIDQIDMGGKNQERPIPAGLRGYRILQISDLHIGSFTSSRQIRRLVSQALQTRPDMVVFTGDMVNFSSAEMDPFMNELAHLQAPDGVYCVLGNHDYGDYVSWADTTARHANLQKMLRHYRRLDWVCLNNAAVRITRGGDTLLLAGVENWGKGKRFPKKGDLSVALSSAAVLETRTSCSVPQASVSAEQEDSVCPRTHTYTVLLSHDPSHFDSVVYLRYPQVDLTLSGHTHGMQMGLRIKGRDYSPARWVYEHYSGLYVMANGQALYVNTGCGFNGVPFRLGIRPSLTLFQF